jgi:hypothetical protein
MNWGGEVPKSYYIDDQGNQLKDEENIASNILGSSGRERSFLNFFAY